MMYLFKSNDHFPLFNKAHLDENFFLPVTAGVHSDW